MPPQPAHHRIYICHDHPGLQALPGARLPEEGPRGCGAWREGSWCRRGSGPCAHPTMLHGPSPPPACQGTGAMCSGCVGRNVFSALGRKTSLKTTGVLIHPLSQIPAQGWPEHPPQSVFDVLWLGAGLEGRAWGLTCGLQRASDSRGYLAMPSQWTQALAIRAASRASVYSSRFLRRQPQGTTACPL